MEGSSSHLNPIFDPEAIARMASLINDEDHFDNESVRGGEALSHSKRIELNPSVIREDPELAQLLFRYTPDQIIRSLSKGEAQPAATTTSACQTPPQVSAGIGDIAQISTTTPGVGFSNISNQAQPPTPHYTNAGPSFSVYPNPTFVNQPASQGCSQHPLQVHPPVTQGCTQGPPPQLHTNLSVNQGYPHSAFPSQFYPPVALGCHNFLLYSLMLILSPAKGFLNTLLSCKGTHRLTQGIHITLNKHKLLTKFLRGTHHTPHNRKSTLH